MKHNLKLLGIIFLIVLFLLLSIIPSINAQIINARKIESFIEENDNLEDRIIKKIQTIKKNFLQINKNFDKKDVCYISAENLYEYGFKVGTLLKKQIKQLSIIMNFFKKTKKIQEMKMEIGIIQKNKYSMFFEELQGFSSGSNLDFDDCIWIYNYMAQHRVSIGKECTSTLSTGKATKNNETFLTQNVDQELKGIGSNLYFSFLRSITKKIWIVDVKSVKYMYCYIGIPVIFEYPLMNEKGLGWGANGLLVTENSERDIDSRSGIATYILERMTMMNCKNVSEVADFWKNSNRTYGEDESWPYFWDKSTTLWCDSEGGILGIEQTNNSLITVFRNSTNLTGGPEDILWHANHHQWIDSNTTESVNNSECRHSYLRSNRAKELLLENYGNISLDVCININRDYKGGSDKYSRDESDICRYPSIDIPIQTVFSWISQPKQKTVYITSGPPDRFNFSKYDLGEIFNEYRQEDDESKQKEELTLLNNCNKNIKIWKTRNKEIIFENKIVYIEDSNLLKNNTYIKLKNFFKGCETPRDFYERTQEEVYDYFFENSVNNISLLHIKNKNISEIINASIKQNQALFSYQQVMLLAAGIKSSFSIYNEENNCFQLKPNCNDFRIEIWRSKCLIPPIKLVRSRMKIVIDIWNGTDFFDINGILYDKIELDTFQNIYRGFDKFNDFLFYPFSPNKLNSVLYTSKI